MENICGVYRSCQNSLFYNITQHDTFLVKKKIYIILTRKIFNLLHTFRLPFPQKNSWRRQPSPYPPIPSYIYTTQYFFVRKRFI